MHMAVFPEKGRPMTTRTPSEDASDFAAAPPADTADDAKPARCADASCAARPQRLINDNVSQQIVESARSVVAKRGSTDITVRDILKDMGITNRVFYNRFHNIDEVLDIIYQEIVEKVRESFALPFDESEDFFEHVHHVAAQTLVISYRAKKSFSQFVFEADGSTEANFSWWNRSIISLIETGKREGLVREDLRADDASYAIWCFIRGFNADALARKLPEDEALRRFHYGFDLLLDGLKSR